MVLYKGGSRAMLLGGGGGVPELLGSCGRGLGAQNRSPRVLECT